MLRRFARRARRGSAGSSAPARSSTRPIAPRPFGNSAGDWNHEPLGLLRAAAADPGRVECLGPGARHADAAKPAQAGHSRSHVRLPAVSPEGFRLAVEETLAAGAVPAR